MPATKPNPVKAEVAPKRKDDNAPRFVKCDLNAQQKESLTAWALEQEEMDMLKWVEDKVTRGHVVSIRSNDVGYQCSVTGTSEGSGHPNMSLVARASTPLKSVYAAWFRDEVVLQGVWPVANRLEELDF